VRERSFERSDFTRLAEETLWKTQKEKFERHRGYVSIWGVPAGVGGVVGG